MFGQYNQCNSCGNSVCSCSSNKSIAPNQVYNLATSYTTTIPGAAGPQGDTFVPIESNDLFTI